MFKLKKKRESSDDLEALNAGMAVRESMSIANESPSADREEDPKEDEQQNASEAPTMTPEGNTPDDSEDEGEVDAGSEDTLREMILQCMSEEPEEHRERLISTYDKIVGALKAGDADMDVLELLRRAADYEDDVASAEAAGELKGRNMRIEEMMRSETADDGVPHPRGSYVSGARTSPSIFDLARGAV